MAQQIRFDPADFRLPAEITRRLLSPALVIYLPHVRRNLRTLFSMTRLDVAHYRPHVKTIKIPQVLSELIDAGIRHFKCATTREAAILVKLLTDAGIQGADVLIAYPLIGPALERAGRIAAGARNVRLSVLCEDPTVVSRIPLALGIFIDLNSGMNRTGLPLDPSGPIGSIARESGDRLGGLHFYDGHLTQPDPDERRRAVFEGCARLCSLVQQLTRDGIEIPEVVTSGTPGFQSALQFDGFADLDNTVHRVSPGTVVYHDLRSQQENPELQLIPAATVFSRVISHPGPGLLTCDAGSKSLAAEAGDPCACAVGHPGWVALKPSEEHLPFRVDGSAVPQRGTQLYLVPRHVCPTVNLADRAILIDSDGSHRTVPVAGRAHELWLDG